MVIRKIPSKTPAIVNWYTKSCALAVTMSDMEMEITGDSWHTHTSHNRQSACGGSWLKFPLSFLSRIPKTTERWRVRIFICMSSVSENHAPTKKRWLLRLFVDFPVIRSPCHVSFDSFRGQNKGKCWFCLASIRWIEVSFTPAVYCSLQHLNLSQDRPLRHYNCHWISCQFFSCFFFVLSKTRGSFWLAATIWCDIDVSAR